MANLVELSNQLEDFPEQQLVQMSQDPNSMYPSYLVLSEIQRRNQMRKMYEAQQPKPETTVAEEVIGEFTGQQGLQGAMAQSPGPQDAFPPSDMGNMAPPSPMQAMASGGIVGYKNKGKTEYKEAADDYGKQLQEIFEKEGRYKKRYSDYEKGERFTYPLTPRDYVVSDEEYSRLKEGDYVMGEGALQEYRPFLMLLNALDGESGARYMPESEVKGLKAKLKASIMEDKLSQMGMASGGRTGYQVGGGLDLSGRDSLSKTFVNPMENQLSNEELQQILEARNVLPRNEDGSFDKSAIAKAVGSGLLTATAAAALIIPEPTTSALGAARLGTMGFGKNLLQLPGKIKSELQGFMGKKALSKDPTKRFGPEDAKGLKPLQTTKQVGAKEISNLKIPTRLAGIGGLAVAGNMINDGVEEVVNNEVINTGPTTEELRIAELERALARKNTISETPKDRGNADMLVGLGGAIGSAKNLGELSSNISDAYFGVQSKRDAKDLAGLQGRLIEAQINKYEADVANMPLDIAIKQYQSLNDLVDSGVLTADEAKIREAALMQRIQQLQGITVAEKDKRDKLLGLVQEVG